MSLKALLARDVVIQTGTPTTDRYNNTTLDWSAPRERQAKAWLAQQSTIENHQQRDATVTSVSATFEVSAELDARERVVVDGQVYEVDGLPNVAHTPRGPHHVEASLKAVVG